MTQPPLQGGLLCPVCRVDLVMSERQGVEIDYCPKCRGVWLDRGELDKILERGAAEGAAQPGAQDRPPASQAQIEPRYDSHDSDEYPAYGRQGYPGYKQRKRRSFLDDIFDFG